MPFLLGFHCYLRPGVVVKVLWRHWSRPQGLRAGGDRGWILSLAPQEEEIPTKTGQFDDTIQMAGRKAKNSQIYLKCYKTYSQMIMLLATFNMDWPGPIGWLMQRNNYVGAPAA